MEYLLGIGQLKENKEKLRGAACKKLDAIKLK